MQQPAGHHLAQLNIGRIRYEVNDPRMAGFVDNLAFVNALAERSEGFVWRYTDESGNATSTRPYGGDPMMAVNMSVWENVESLEKYVWQTVHKRFYARRHEWFETMAERHPSPSPAVFKNLGVAYQGLGATRADAPAAMVRAWRRYLAMAPSDDPDLPKIRQAVDDTERTLATRTAR